MEQNEVETPAADAPATEETTGAADATPSPEGEQAPAGDAPQG